MKTVNTVLKVLTALAAVAGVIYVVATYGDKIVAWAKKMLGTCHKCACCKDDEACEGAEGECECAEETPAEAAPAEEPAEENPQADETVQAEETDFEA